MAKSLLRVSVLGTALLLAIGSQNSVRAQSHDDAFSKDDLKTVKEASSEPNLTLALHPNDAITPNTNVIWCSTMQLAWNEAIGLVGEKMHFLNAPPQVASLNQEDYTKADLDPSCYVAIADFERNHVEDEIRAALEKKFNGAASPKLIPPVPEHPHPDDFLAYAYLFKNLSFATKFASGTLYFNNVDEVKAFNFGGSPDDPDSYAQRDQVSILSYTSREDFVIELKTQDKNEQLILAKLTPGKTLTDTMEQVLRHVKHPDQVPLENDDIFGVPKLNFDVTSHFLQLEGLLLVPGANSKVGPLKIDRAMQNIRFQLNEEGVKLKSEATLGMKAMAMRPMVEPHYLVFDKPFLIMMKEKGKEPYFAMWVGNEDFLAKVTKE